MTTDTADPPLMMLNPLAHAVAGRDAKVVEMVRRAVQDKRVILAFQPVVQTRDPDRVAFYEGLVRVLDEEGQVIPARHFILSVEETEIGRQLDCIALEKGLEELSAEPDLRLSINMSARSIGYRRWLSVLKRGIEADPTVAERLILEITESSAIVVPDLLSGFMRDLQAEGVSFAIDDFGAGYTALRHFKDFSFDILKIDGQFIDGIAEDVDNQVLVQAMISIADQFDMFTVAERVECSQDAECLVELGVDCLQGFHFAAPTVAPHWRADEEQQRA